jgi:hypothetical protein
VGVINLNDARPPAPAGVNVKWQADAANPRDVSAYVQDAATGAKGVVELAGDLGGTASLPKVLGLDGVALDATIGAPADGNVVVFSASAGKWRAAPPSLPALAGAIGITIDGGASSPTTGSKGFTPGMPYAGTITGWEIIGDVAGSAQITVKKSSDAGFPTTASIVASAPIYLSSEQKRSSTVIRLAAKLVGRESRR